MSLRRWLLGACLVGLLGAGTAAAGAYYLVRGWLEAPLGLPDGEVFVVASGSSLSGVAARLATRGWLERPRWLTLLGRWRGDATRIQAGEYLTDARHTPADFLAMLVAGRVVLHEVTLIEGWTVREAVAAVREHPQIEPTSATRSAEALAAALGVTAPATPGGQAPGGGDAAPPPPTPWAVLEGRLFPDTYRFPKDTPDIVVLRQASERLERELAQAWAGRATELPVNAPQALLVLASIIEKESGLPAERPRIAGVFVRRLQRRMRLQSDPTVIYGLGDAYDGDIRRRDLRTPTPYNTYTQHGLPPTPIALVGKEALWAAAHPAEGDALYFVATGDGQGGHYFSATLEEHNAAVRRYLQRTREASRP